MKYVLVSIIALAACNFEVPDLNNPSLNQLAENPTAATVNSACVGQLVGLRANHASTLGYLSQLGVLGREAYVLDTTDPRYVASLLEAPFQRGSAFGAGLWAGAYGNMRLAKYVQAGALLVKEYSEEDKRAVLGFSRTIEALDLLSVIATRDSNGAVILADGLADIAPIASKEEVYARISELLELAYADLTSMTSREFPFELSKGFEDFDKTDAFAQFNRAVAGRVFVYREMFDDAITALAASFLNEEVTEQADLNKGVYHVHSLAPGDMQNGLVSKRIYVHPSIVAGVEGSDRRGKKFEALKEAEFVSLRGLKGTHVFTIYDSPEASASIIRNEELILLRAEALARKATPNLAGAMQLINRVRLVASGEPAVPASDLPAVLDRLMYERTYSLLFEGHRWIDARRLGRLERLPLDNPTDDGKVIQHVRNARFLIPQDECDARLEAPACQLGSL